MTAYAAEMESAARDIAEAGAPVTFKRPASAYNSTTGGFSGGPTTASSDALRVKGDASRRKPGLILNQPITLLVAALNLGDFVPTGEIDSMTFGGTTYAVKDVDPFAPDGTAITYRITGSL